MGDNNYGHLFAEHFVRAVPWAIVFSLSALFTVNMTMSLLRQDVKEAMEYGSHMILHQAIREVLTDEAFNDVLLPKIKQNAKEAVEFAAVTAARAQAQANRAGGAAAKK